MNNTASIENYPGFKSIMGPDLAQNMYDSSVNFGAEYVYGTVSSVEDHGDDKTIKTDEDELQAKVVIIATGSEYKKLGITGEHEYGGKGVSYCAVCDGAFFKNKDVVVVGGGDSAIEEASYLAGIVNHVTVIHRRDQLRAQQVIQDRAFANDKIDFVWNSNVTEVLGDDNKVTGVKVVNNQTNEQSTIETSGVFIYVGLLPMTTAFEDLKITDADGWIKTNDQMETAIPGIYAIGDVRQKDLRQIATAVGEGGIAGQQAFKYVEKLSDKSKSSVSEH